MLKKFVLMIGMTALTLVGTVLYAEENPAVPETIQVEEIAVAEEGPNDASCADCNPTPACAPVCAAAMRCHYRQCCRWYTPCAAYCPPVRLISYQPCCPVFCAPSCDPCAVSCCGYVSCCDTGGHRGHHARKMARRMARGWW